MNIWADVFKRSVALVILRVSGTFAGGSIAGIELWQSAAVAGFLGLMEVAESLSRAYMMDGKLDPAEVNAAFGGALDEDVDPAMAEVIIEPEDTPKA